MNSFTTTYKITYDSLTEIIPDCHRYLSLITWTKSKRTLEDIAKRTTCTSSSAILNFLVIPLTKQAQKWSHDWLDLRTNPDEPLSTAFKPGCSSEFFEKNPWRDSKVLFCWHGLKCFSPLRGTTNSKITCWHSISPLDFDTRSRLRCARESKSGSSYETTTTTSRTTSIKKWIYILPKNLAIL